MEDVTLELVDELRRKAAALTTEVGRLTVERNEQKLEIENLKAQLDALLQRLYGRKSERFTSWNGPDFLDLMGYEDPKPEEAPPEETEKVEYTRKRPRPRGPKPLPDHLERIVVEVDPEDEARQCSCCSEPMERTGEIVTEELDIVPAKFRVKRFVQGKYSCPSCMNRDLTKPLPERPIQKGRPSPTLLAYLIVAKYVDHRVPSKAVCEMRERPLVAELQDLAANRLELLRSRAGVVSVKEKARMTRQVRVGETSASEPLMKRRKRMSSSKPRSGGCLGRSAGGTCLLPAWRPALRRRESDSGSYTELGNLSP